MSDIVKSQVVNSGKSSYELRIDTDGSASNSYGDKYYQSATSSSLAADKVPFIVVPGGSTTLFGKTKSASSWMRYLASVYDPSTKRTVWAVCGDVGPSGTAWREVSIKLAWMLGYKNVSGSISAPSHKYVITVYNKQLSKSNCTPEKIKQAGETILKSSLRNLFIQEAESHKGERGDWTWKTSGVVYRPTAWCAGFITACAKAVGGILDIVMTGDSFAAGIPRKSVKKSQGTFYKGPAQGESFTPEKGDIIVFRYSNRTYSDKYDADHIAIVRSYNAITKSVNTVGGNEGGGYVKYNSYNVKNKTISGYYRPNWSQVGSPSSGTRESKANYGPLFEKENTREDAVVREVGYLDNNGEPSINMSDIKLSVINYTSLIGDVFDIVRASWPAESDIDISEVDSDDYTPSNSQYLSLLYPCPEYKTITCGFGAYVGHTGCDFSTNNKVNQKIIAAEDGEVVISTDLKNSDGSYRSYGRYIVIKHKKKTKSGKTAYTLYAHNNERLVKVGDIVKRGQQIAKSGSTGNSSGPHCHFELRIGGNFQSYAVNPSSWFHDL